jgi:hypothetical protein
MHCNKHIFKQKNKKQKIKKQKNKKNMEYLYSSFFS